MEIVMAVVDEDALIAEIAREIAGVTMIEDDDEALLDMLYAEHEAMLYAVNSYDLDADAYGQM